MLWPSTAKCRHQSRNSHVTSVKMLISKITIIKKLSKFQYGLAYFGKSINTKAEIVKTSARVENTKYKSTSARKYHNQTQTWKQECQCHQIFERVGTRNKGLCSLTTCNCVVLQFWNQKIVKLINKRDMFVKLNSIRFLHENKHVWRSKARSIL